MYKNLSKFCQKCYLCKLFPTFLVSNEAILSQCAQFLGYVGNLKKAQIAISGLIYFDVIFYMAS